MKENGIELLRFVNTMHSINICETKNFMFCCYHRSVVGQMENKIPSTRRREEKNSARSHTHTHAKPTTKNNKHTTMITMNNKSNVLHISIQICGTQNGGPNFILNKTECASPKQYLHFQANFLSTLFPMFAKYV